VIIFEVGAIARRLVSIRAWFKKKALHMPEITNPQDLFEFISRAEYRNSTYLADRILDIEYFISQAGKSTARIQQAIDIYNVELVMKE